MSNCPKQTISTDSELEKVFGDGIIVGILPNTPNGASDRDDNGKLLQTTLSTILTSLKGKGIIPSPKSYTEDVFVEKQTAMIQNIQSEYCFYEARYKYALDKLFSAVKSGYLTNSPDTQKRIQSILSITQTLNLRLNDLTQIINTISEDMLYTSNSLQEEIKKYNEQIQQQRTKLDYQNSIISSSEAATKIRKEMVKYTEEKAKYSDNLLKLYSFLNIVTLGLLVYVYKAAGDQ
jgi:methyl-accepting chemotaxis protein